MKNIWMLALANLRKNKGQTISLYAFVLIAAMFLNIGLMIFIGISSIFDKCVDELHAEHFTGIYSNSVSIEEQTKFVEEYAGITETQIQNTIGGLGDYTINGAKSTAYMYFARMDENQKLGEPSLIGDSSPLVGDAIYIPYFMLLNGGYKIGDKFPLTISGVELNFTVAGGVEEIILGAQNNTVHRFYVSDENFENLRKELPGGEYNLLSGRFENKEDAAFLTADLRKEFSSEGLIFVLTIDDAKKAHTMITTIIAVIIMAFAIILLVVSLIVIRFRIINSIEESMTNIGALKAFGYRSKQIVSSIVWQFGITTVIGIVSGIALSYGVMPLIITVVQPIFALLWNLAFNLSLAMVSMFIILLAVTITALISAWKINKLHPLIALRGGITTHSFRRNIFPLDKSRGSLNLLFALKQLMQNKKQSFTIGVIVAVVTMASVAVIALNYTMNQDRDNFARTLFGEVPEVNFILKAGENGEAFKEKLLKNPDVRKVFGYQSPLNLLAEEMGIIVTVVEDCTLLEGKMLIDGYYPKYDNEIALGSVFLKVSGKKIGDTITVKAGEIQKDYIVTGIVQILNNNGFNGVITGSGLEKIQPDFKFVGYNIYLKDRSKTIEFIDGVKLSEGNIFDNVLNAEEQLGLMLDGMSSIFSAVAVGIVIITGFVVILTLYMVIRTMIQRRKHELGIQKAVGFTTWQLMNQIAFNMTPVILFGIIAGAVAGCFAFNPLVAMLLSGMGIIKINFSAPLDQITMVCIVLAVLAYAVSMMIAWRIRKISAYSLVSE